MLEYARFRGAAGFLHERLEAEIGFRYRSAPLPPELRRVSLDLAEAIYDPELLGEAIGGLLRMPPPIDLRHVRAARDAWRSAWRTCAACCARRGFSFDDAVRGRRPGDRGDHPVRAARAVQGRARWRGSRRQPFGPITITSVSGLGCRVEDVVNELARIVEALLFLSAGPCPVDVLADACEVSEGEVVEALARSARALREGYAAWCCARWPAAHARHRPGGRARRATTALASPHAAAHPG